MAEEKPMIESLGYIGGQDEDLGGYCEPLIIRVNGDEHYVLHEMHTYRDSADEDKIKAKHSKVEFGGLEELTSEFDKVKARLGIDSSLPWVETDSNCGYDLPKEAWEKAYARSP
jgi:hypothetical protein